MARSSPQSAQRYPLTTILGTEANVRLLRELVRHGGQMSAPLLADRSGLAKASVWAALIALQDIGIVSSAGTGRARLYQARADHPLSDALNNLFAVEEARFTGIHDAIRSAAEASGPGVLAVWIYGSVARGEDRPDSDIDIAVIAKSPERARVVDAMRDALIDPAKAFGFAPAIVGLDPCDIERLSRERDPWWIGVLSDTLVVLGHRPDDLAPGMGRGKAAA